MSQVITRKLEFDAGHRLLHHEGKCAHLHGHRYVAEIGVCTGQLDDVGRVIDFSVVKSVMQKWIDERWDHNILLHVDDPLVSTFIDVERKIFYSASLGMVIFNDKMPYICAANPTAENMVQHLAYYASQFLPPTIRVVHVKLSETPNCWATWDTERDGLAKPVLTPEAFLH